MLIAIFSQWRLCAFMLNLYHNAHRNAGLSAAQLDHVITNEKNKITINFKFNGLIRLSLWLIM